MGLKGSWFSSWVIMSLRKSLWPRRSSPFVLAVSWEVSPSLFMMSALMALALFISGLLLRLTQLQGAQQELFGGIHHFHVVLVGT